MYPHGFREANADFELTADNLLAGVTHLYAALQYISTVEKAILNGSISSFAIDEDLRQGYLEANSCRLYTENVAVIEEVLQSVLGNLYSTWAMNDHLAAKGYTKTGLWSMMTELGRARIGVLCCIEQLENAMGREDG